MGFNEIALSLFFTLNGFGNIPLITALLSPYEFKRQLYIVAREMLIGLLILLIFGFFGLKGLNFLNIDQSVMGVAGGIILFLIAISMMFPKQKSADLPQHEPFIVPIATPVIVGPGTLAMMAVFFHQANNDFMVISAAILAWFITTVVLLASCFLKKILHLSVLLATERLMGMILSLIATQMAVNAILKYFS